MPDMYERKPQNLTGPGGDQKELRVKYIDNGDGTWSLSVGALVLPLPAGAATSAKQDTTNVKLDAVIAALGGGGFKDYAYVQKDTTSDLVSYKYYGYENTSGAWCIKRVNRSTNLAEFALTAFQSPAVSPDTYANAWSLRASLDYLSYGGAF